MRWILCFTCVVLLIQGSSAHTVSTSPSSSSSFYQYYPGLVWDHCAEPVSASRSQCATMCEASSFCLGIIYLEDLHAPKPCQLCLSSATKSLSNASSSSSTSMYFRFNAQIHQPTDDASDFYLVDLPNGLADGQVIFFRTKPEHDTEMEILFLDNVPWKTDPRPEADLLIQVYFGDLVRQNTIVLDNFDTVGQCWPGPYVHKPVGGFLRNGSDTYTVVFVNRLTYTVYIDGKLFDDYPRSQRRELKDIKHLRLQGSWPSVHYMTV